MDIVRDTSERIILHITLRQYGLPGRTIGCSPTNDTIRFPQLQGYDTLLRSVSWQHQTLHGGGVMAREDLVTTHLAYELEQKRYM